MKGILLMLLVVLCLILPDDASPSAMQEGVKLKAHGKVIDVELGHLVPCVTDWKGDGKKDLLEGQFKGGKIRVHLNHGTDSKPWFTDFSYLSAGGGFISLPYG